MAMSEKFDDIRSKARIDNFLAGTSQSPDRVKPDATARTRRTWTQPFDRAVRPASGTPRSGRATRTSGCANRDTSDGTCWLATCGTRLPAVTRLHRSAAGYWVTQIPLY